MASSDSDLPRKLERLLGVIRTQNEIAKLGLDLGGVMTLVAAQASLLTGADGAVVEMAEGDDMVYRAVAGMAEPQLGLRIARATSLSGACVATGQPMRCDDAWTDPRVDRLACEKVGLRSMIVVPLKHHDAQVGVLKVLAREPSAFEQADVEILELMTELIAASMYHATHFGSDGLFHQATHDALTGLANRALFYDRARHGLASARRTRQRLALMILDLDNLKPINDNLGHRAGDASLLEVASRLRSVSRQSDTVARLGGDEFGALLMPVADREGLESHAGRMAEAINGPFSFDGNAIELRASLGLSLYPEDGEEIDQLVDKADRAMYAAKRTARSRSSAASASGP